MFKKPGNIKSSTALRSSDLRRLRDEFCNTYSISLEVSKQLLPDSLLITKGLTHLDEHCTLYSVLNGKDLVVMAFKLGKEVDGGKLLPTIHSLDSYPALINGSITTVEPVIQKLLAGSALFARGVQCSYQNLPSTAQQGHLVSIIASHSPNAPIQAIGYLDRSKTVLLRQLARREKGEDEEEEGKAVNTLHVRGDWLYSLANGKHAEKVIIPEENSSTLADLTLDDPIPEMTVESVVVMSVVTPAEVDIILRNALLLLLSKKSLQALPIPASALYSLLLPYRPHYINPSLTDIKKSSYKKTSAFFKAATGAGLMLTKEIKGELMIMSINIEHPDVESVRSYKTLADTAKQLSTATAPLSASESVPTLEILTYTIPSAKILSTPLFADIVAPEENAWTTSIIRNVLAQYVSRNKLAHPGDGKYILLDPLLSATLLSPEENLEFMSKDAALAKLLVGSNNYYEVRSGGKKGVMQKGVPGKIKITTKRVGKRDVTLVTGLEAFPSISTDSLMEELKKSAASSVSISPVTGSTGSKKIPMMEIMIQGKVEGIVTGALLKRGVPRGYIDGAKEVKKK